MKEAIFMQAIGQKQEKILPTVKKEKGKRPHRVCIQLKMLIVESTLLHKKVSIAVTNVKDPTASLSGADRDKKKKKK